MSFFSSLVPVPFIESSIFFLPISSATSLECQVSIRMWACLWAVFCTTFLFVYPYISIPILISSEVHTLFFKVVLVMLVFLCFLVDSWLRLSSFTNKPVGFLFGTILPLKVNLWKISIFTILSVLICELV